MEGDIVILENGRKSKVFCRITGKEFQTPEVEKWLKCRYAYQKAHHHMEAVSRLNKSLMIPSKLDVVTVVGREGT